MNHEVSLLNAIIESGDIATCIEQSADSVFAEHSDVWNFIMEFYTEYGSCPSKDVVSKNFGSFQFFKVESPLQYYIDEAKKSNLNRGVRTSLANAAEALRSGDDPMKVLTLIQNQASELMRDSGRMKDANITDWSERAEILKDRIANPDHMVLGVPSGINTIDAHFGGFQPGDFIVVIGWTGVGKSAITRLFAANAWAAGFTPLIISLEMDRVQEEFRMDTILNRGKVFNNAQLTNGKNIEFDVYESWAQEMYDGMPPIHLVTSDGLETVDQHLVQAKIEQYKPDLVVLDYHTLFDDAGGATGETEKAKNLSKAFKRIALRNRVPVIDVSGVTMEDGHDDRPPDLNEIAWSKQLSYDADMVLAVHRSPGSDEFTCVTRKTRRCSPFAFNMKWDLNSGDWKEYYDYENFTSN